MRNASAKTFHNFEMWLKEKAAAQEANPDVNQFATTYIEGEIANKKMDAESFDWKSAFEGLVNFDRGIDMSNPLDISARINESMYPAITQPLVRALAEKNYAAEIGQLLSIFNQSDAQHPSYEKWVGVTPFGDLQHRPYGKDYEKTKPGEETLETQIKDFGVITDLTIEDIAGDPNMLLVRKVSNGGEAQGRLLAKILCETIEMGSARATFDDATNGGYIYKGTRYSGLGSGTTNFYDLASHSGIDGQTNINATPSAFSSSGVEECQQLMAVMTDPAGRKITVMPRVLIGHQYKWVEMSEFLGSDRKYDTAENTVNVWQGGMRLVTSPYFSNTARYWVGDPLKQLMIRWFERPTTIVRSGLTEENFKARVVQSYRHNLWLGVFHLDYRFLVSGGASS